MKIHSSQQLDVIIDEYRQHLLHCQGLTQGTIRWHTRQVRHFLRASFGRRTIKLDRLRVVDLHNYVSDLGSRFQWITKNKQMFAKMVVNTTRAR